MKNVCLYAAGLCVVTSLILEIVSSASYPTPGTLDYSKQKVMNQTHSWSVLLMLLAVALGVICPYIPKSMPDF